MLRTKARKIPAKLKQAWKDEIVPVADAALADFRTWPLYECLGKPWPDSPKRFVRVTSLAAITKGLRSKATEALSAAANPGLKAMYLNLSEVLNIRHQHFGEVWGRYRDIVDRAAERAIKALKRRLQWKPEKRDEGWLSHIPQMYLSLHVWEHLHPHALEATFWQHHVTILRAGHAPAGMQGNDWTTCSFLYY